jgi:hypothetical protein
MPSVVTLEDIADELYTLGVHSPVHVSRILMLVERYADARNPVITPAVNDQYYYLKPGESDVPEGKTRCRHCFKVKLWRLFPEDVTSMTRHGNICTLCLRNPESPSLILLEDREMPCKGCKLLKNVSLFLRNGSSKTGFGYYCEECRKTQRKVKEEEC